VVAPSGREGVAGSQAAVAPSSAEEGVQPSRVPVLPKEV
jgi:hypothetical protein